MREIILYCTGWIVRTFDALGLAWQEGFSPRPGIIIKV